MKLRVTETHLADPTSRAALPRRKSPYWLPLRRGLALGYRFGLTESTWIVKALEPGIPASRQQESLGFADDRSKANGGTVLDFDSARRLALRWQPRPDSRKATFHETLAQPTTVGDVVLAHLTWLEHQGKAIEKARSMANCHLNHQPIARILLQDLTYTHLDDWRNEIGASRRKNLRQEPEGEERLPLEASAEIQEQTRARQCTSNRVLAFLKAALNRAEKAGRASKNPLWAVIDGSAWRLVKPFAGVYRARQRFLTLEEQQALVAACPEDLKQLVQGALATGARFGELAQMKARNVILASSTITLPTSKTKAKREIPILGEAKGFFRELLKGKASGDLLFTKADGMPWGVNHYVRPLQAAVEKADIDPVIFHELRHTYASTLLMSGVTPAALARALGHKNEKMVLETYGHLRANWATQEILSKAPWLGIFGAKRRATGKNRNQPPAMATPPT